MITNYVNDQHETWDQFLREFAYAFRTAVNETKRKTPAELLLSQKLITPFPKLVMVSNAVGDIEGLFDEARRNTRAKHEKWAKYYDRRRRDVQIKVNDWVLIKTHPVSSARKEVVAKFKPKFEGPYRVLEVKQNNLVIWRSGKRLTVNVDQVRIYHRRKSDEMEIRTGSSDSNSSRYKSSIFESVQRRSNESQHGRKKGSGVKCELEEKGLVLRKIRVRGTQVGPIRANHLSDQHQAPGHKQIPELKGVKKKLAYKRSLNSGSGGPERKQRKGQGHQGEKRRLTLSSNNELQYSKKRCRGEEIVMPSTSGYNLRPRRGAKVESRPTNEKRTQQGGPVQARGSREHQYCPYIEEQARSAGRKTRSRSCQQQHCQERKGGANSRWSQSLEVQVRDASYRK
ncbi:uncharacterized protein TNCV_4495451 [Trichonephila clavipes]|nr:uncharacterized protein TNCV_4495451 [Trichonephila clavipes]